MLIKNPDYQCTLSRTDRPKEFTCYALQSQAKASVNPSLNPVLVRLSGGGREWYDAFPLNHPLPRQATVYYNDEGGTVRATVEPIACCVQTVRGMRWKKIALEAK